MALITNVAIFLLLAILHQSRGAPPAAGTPPPQYGGRYQDINVFNPHNNAIGPPFQNSLYGGQTFHGAAHHHFQPFPPAYPSPFAPAFPPAYPGPFPPAFPPAYPPAYSPYNPYNPYNPNPYNPNPYNPFNPFNPAPHYCH